MATSKIFHCSPVVEHEAAPFETACGLLRDAAPAIGEWYKLLPGAERKNQP